MILKSDGTVTQPVMDAILLAMDGGSPQQVVKRAEAQKILGVSLRQLDKLANAGHLERIPGIGSRGIGYSFASVARYSNALTLKRTGQTP